MRRAFAVLMIFCSPALGQEIDVPPNCRVGNPDNRCFGAALEDCARALGMRSLYRVSGQFRGGTCYQWTERNGRKVVTYSKISDVLTHRGWRQPENYEEIWTGDARWLDRRIQAGYPVVVSFGNNHGVCLRKLTATEAIIVDNDGMRTPQGFYWANSDRRMSRQAFLRQWRVLGWAVCLYREPGGYRVPGPPRRVPAQDPYYPRYDR
jgi:hypothetical protein